MNYHHTFLCTSKYDLANVVSVQPTVIVEHSIFTSVLLYKIIPMNVSESSNKWVDSQEMLITG